MKRRSGVLGRNWENNRCWRRTQAARLRTLAEIASIDARPRQRLRLVRRQSPASSVHDARRRTLFGARHIESSAVSSPSRKPCRGQIHDLVFEIIQLRVRQDETLLPPKHIKISLSEARTKGNRRSFLRTDWNSKVVKSAYVEIIWVSTTSYRET